MSLCACERAEGTMNGVCRHCWGTQLGAKKRRYLFTPALRTELKLAYAQPRRAKHAAIAALQAKTGYPRHIFKVEAARMGITGEIRRPWTGQEDRFLAGALGERSIKEIAGKLNRTHESVKARAERLGLSTRIRTGYCITDLMQIFGVPRYRIHEWIEKGLLPVSHTDSGVRSSDSSVMGFLKQNYNLIDFRLADQTWLKGAIFGS